MKKSFIIISSIEWDTIWQTQQRLATSLSEDSDVLFLENTGVRSPKLKDFKRIKERIYNWFKSTKGFREIKERLIVNYPLFLPFPYSKLSTIINKYFIYKSINNWIKANNIRDVIIITFLPTPLSFKLIQKIDPSILVYYCANQMEGHQKQHKKIIPWEKMLLKDSDLVFVISETLKIRAQKISNNVYKFPAGVEYEKFIKAKNENCIPEIFTKITNPVIGYVGAIGEVFDIDLVCFLIKNNPNVNFLFIGPQIVKYKILNSFKNLILLDQIAHDLIPHYINNFKIGIIPYIINDFTNSVYSSKLNEYLVLGIPVISTNTQEMKTFSEENERVVDVAKDKYEFLNLIRANLKNNSDLKINNRIKIANKNSWKERYLEIKKLIDETHDSKKTYSYPWQIRLKNIYKVSRNNFLKFLASIIFVFVIIFYSPLFWFLGNQLVIRETPNYSDAIVVFSGNGEPAYQNPSYQKRAIDAVKYFNQGYAKTIILSSGRKQLYTEVKLLEALLIFEGIPRNSLIIMEEYPSSTFENISLVRTLLKKKNFNEIIFITSPYHSLRANLIWNKIYEDLIIHNVEVIDTPSKNILWKTNLDQIRVIVYEYLALMYNWYKGYL